MRIAIIHHQLKLKGGMETYLFNLINEFNRQKDDVTIHVYKKVRLKEPPCNVKRHNLFYLPQKLRKIFFGWHIHKDDVLKTYDLRISLMRAINQNILICGGTHLGYLKHTAKRAKFLDKMEIKLEKESYHSADLIVVHSHSLTQELLEYYQVPKEKIVCLHPPIDIEKFNQRYQCAKQLHRQRLGIASDKTILLFPSTGHERKGIHLLLEAVKRLPEQDFELIIAGDAIPHNNIPNCKYMGFVEDMALLYSVADVTVLPSYYEPFGLVAMESLQCGTPVVLSKFVGAIDIIKPEHGIILEELTVDHLVQALLTIKNKRMSVANHFAQGLGLTLSEHVKQLKSEFLRKVSHETKEKETR